MGLVRQKADVYDLDSNICEDIVARDTTYHNIICYLTPLSRDRSKNTNIGNEQAIKINLF